LGYANQASLEVKRDRCREMHIPILRRCSGGGTVLQGPGCLNYTLILRVDASRPVSTIAEANAHIMGAHQRALASLLNKEVAIEGHTDLAIGGRKFSGNAQRRKRRFLLFHGSFLLDFDLSLIEHALLLPSKQPVYRRNRSHLEFLMNLKLPADAIKRALRSAWSANETLDRTPTALIEQMAKEKYSQVEWTFRFP